MQCGEIYPSAGGGRKRGRMAGREEVRTVIFKIDLLDALSIQADCRYLSDLKYLDEWQRMRLARELERVPSDAADLKEWNDALQYLSRDAPQKTAEAARERLIQSLSRPR